MPRNSNAEKFRCQSKGELNASTEMLFKKVPIGLVDFLGCVDVYSLLGLLYA